MLDWLAGELMFDAADVEALASPSKLKPVIHDHLSVSSLLGGADLCNVSKDSGVIHRDHSQTCLHPLFSSQVFLVIDTGFLA